MRVLTLTPEWEDDYESFVLSHPDALVYYSLRFRNLLTDVLHCRPCYAIAVENRAVTGVLPLMASEGRYGMVLNSLPYFGSNGGILAQNDRARKALEQWYRHVVAETSIAASTVVANPLNTDTVPVVDDLVSDRVGHITFFRDWRVESPGRQVWAAIESSARRNVNKASRHSVVVTTENDNLDELAVLHRQSMALTGAPIKEPPFFGSVPIHFRPGLDYAVYMARIRGQPVAALLLFYYAETVDYYMPALHPDYRSLQPMAAILYRAMADAISRGFQRWNWGGSGVSHESLIRFKEKWGGQRRTYRYWIKVNNPDLRSTTAATISQEYPGFFVLPFCRLAASA